MTAKGFMRRLAGRIFYWAQGWEEPKPRPLDLFFGHPRAAFFVDLVKSARWTELEQAYLALRTDERHIMLSALAQDHHSSGTFSDWTAASDSFVAPLFRGTLLTYLAWDARGSARGSEVTEEAAEQFVSLLDDAWNHLLAAHQKADDDPEPIARLLPVAMGLNAPRETLEDIFERYKAMQTPHLGAALNMVDAISPKWLGSTDEMFAVARAYAELRPEHVVAIAHAHVENWCYLHLLREDPSSKSYFTTEAVQRELRECWQREADLASRRDFFGPATLNTYAFCFLMMQDDALLTQALELVGEHATRRPWIYVSEHPHWVLETARKDLGLKPS